MYKSNIDLLLIAQKLMEFERFLNFGSLVPLKPQCSKLECSNLIHRFPTLYQMWRKSSFCVVSSQIPINGRWPKCFCMIYF